MSECKKYAEVLVQCYSLISIVGEIAGSDSCLCFSASCPSGQNNAGTVQDLDKKMDTMTLPPDGGWPGQRRPTATGC